MIIVGVDLERAEDLVDGLRKSFQQKVLPRLHDLGPKMKLLTYQGLQKQLRLMATVCNLHRLPLLLPHQPFSQIVFRTTTPHLSHTQPPALEPNKR